MSNKTDQLSSYLSNYDKLRRYLETCGKKHNYYKFYSKFSTILKVQTSKKIILSDGSNWNDKIDRELFNKPENTYKNYGMCFSCSQDENVAMWMLYGGIDKCGGMIDFTKTAMNNILSVQSVIAGRLDENGNFIEKKSLTREQYKLFCIDVVYYINDKGEFYITKAYDRKAKINKTILDKLSVCKKSYPWQYENECRLICTVKKSSLDDECSHVCIDLNGLHLGQSLKRVYYGPCFPPSKIDSSNQIIKSKLYGSIDWSLCKGPCVILGNLKQETGART